MGKMTLRLADDLHASLGEAAEREHRSLHAEIVVRLERSFRGSAEGEAAAPAVAAVSPVPASEVDDPATLPAGAVIEGTPKQLAAVTKRAADAAITAEAAESPAPAAPQPIPKSLDEVLGDAKERPKPKGTVSGRQALLAQEAQLRAQQREDLFSLVCPERDKHEPGVRCPLCKGIR